MAIEYKRSAIPNFDIVAGIASANKMIADAAARTKEDLAAYKTNQQNTADALLARKVAGQADSLALRDYLTGEAQNDPALKYATALAWRHATDRRSQAIGDDLNREKYLDTLNINAHGKDFKTLRNTSILADMVGNAAIRKSMQNNDDIRATAFKAYDDVNPVSQEQGRASAALQRSQAKAREDELLLAQYQSEYERLIADAGDILDLRMDVVSRERDKIDPKDTLRYHALQRAAKNTLSHLLPNFDLNKSELTRLSADDKLKESRWKLAQAEYRGYKNAEGDRLGQIEDLKGDNELLAYEQEQAAIKAAKDEIASIENKSARFAELAKRTGGDLYLANDQSVANIANYSDLQNQRSAIEKQLNILSSNSATKEQKKNAANVLINRYAQNASIKGFTDQINANTATLAKLDKEPNMFKKPISAWKQTEISKNNMDFQRNRANQIADMDGDTQGLARVLNFETMQIIADPTKPEPDIATLAAKDDMSSFTTQDGDSKESVNKSKIIDLARDIQEEHNLTSNVAWELAKKAIGDSGSSAGSIKLAKGKAHKLAKMIKNPLIRNDIDRIQKINAEMQSHNQISKDLIKLRKEMDDLVHKQDGAVPRDRALIEARLYTLNALYIEKAEQLRELNANLIYN